MSVPSSPAPRSAAALARRLGLALACGLALGCAPGRVPAPSAPAGALERAASVAAAPSETFASLAAPSEAFARPAAPSEAPVLPPLEGSEAFVDLPVPGHRAALVGLPLGASGPRPVLVATHGALGHARPHCELWQAVVGARAFVLCPRGARMAPALPDDAYGHFYPGHPKLADEVTHALAALAARYGAHVDLAAPVYVGFSQGANMGALVLPSHPAHFARALLIEGGVGEHQEWNVAVAERLRAQGGVRVVLACGRYKCAQAALRTEPLLRRGGLDTELVYVGTGGHRIDGDMAPALAAAFARLVADDPRFVAGPGPGG
ncbi:MAG: hypothetical protein IT373_01410 [Polyangiaceae bacterium]|nr:hypothetical protein [Polyangiaceae bacterium]